MNASNRSIPPEPSGDRDLGPDDPVIPQRLVADLQMIYSTPAASRTIDDAVLNRANARLAGLRRRSTRQRWWGSAAAAALILLGFGIVAWRLGFTPGSRPAHPVAISDRMDLNGDQRVDILDAFYLARQITPASKSVPTPVRTDRRSMPESWDINGDGVVDQRDVDLIASRAVALEPVKGVMQ